MDKDYFVKLTLAVYRVTELFPGKEVLKFDIRERANQILADSVLFFSKNPVNLAKEEGKELPGQILRNIKVLEGFFEIAENQDWVEKANFFVLKKEYSKIGEELKELIFERKEEKPEKQVQEKSFALFSLDNLRNERGKKILEILRERKTGQVRDFTLIFPEVSKRTLRRDFEYLLAKGLVERLGDANTTLYRLPEGQR